MLEQEIKASLINYLRSKSSIIFDGVIINEFVFDNFNRRADLLIVNKNRFFAYEIKSEFDDLSRLTGQVEQYLKYFDKVTIVAAPKHIDYVVSNTPSCVEVLVVKKENSFKVVRRGRLSTTKDKKLLLNLLKIKELKMLSKKFGLFVDDNVRSSISLTLLKLNKSTIKEYVTECISSRYKYSSEAFKLLCDGRFVNKEDLKYLSNNIKISNPTDNILRLQQNTEDKNMIKMQNLSTNPIFGDVPRNIIELLKYK
jgi:hypothetical protein